MVDIAALMKALPVSSIKPNGVAWVENLIKTPRDQHWLEQIDLLEPPAGQRVPYINPVSTLIILLRRQGLEPQEAKLRALSAASRMRIEVADDRWVNFFDFYDSDAPDCLPVPDFVAWLNNEHRCVQRPTTGQHHETVLIPSDIIEYLGRVGEVASTEPLFYLCGDWEASRSLQNLPANPPAEAMVEYFPGTQWPDDEWFERWTSPENPFMQWRGSMRPIALDLEKALGEPVYYFADLTFDLNDDRAHRLLVLHWFCTHKPDSTFVRYLQKVTGAKDVEELKTALIDPTNYSQPFKMHHHYFGPETIAFQIAYLSPDEHKTVAVVFFTEQARETAQSVLAQQVGTCAYIVAPPDLATEEWVKQAIRHCRGGAIRYVYDGKLDNPINILASVDELFVIADESAPTFGSDLKLSEPVEDLLWLAVELGVECWCRNQYRWSNSEIESCLKKLGVPERVAARKARRAAFTRQLKTIRLDNDFGSSGLWDAQGRNLGYDLLDLPFPLVRRIAAWQKDFNDTEFPPSTSDDAWWDRHEREAIDISKMLQEALGSETVVTLFQGDDWISVDQYERTME